MSDPPNLRAADPQRRVAVVTDTTPYLPRELIDRWDIGEVSLYVGWDGDLRPEDEYRDLDAFYARLRKSPSLPTTSQPSVGTSVPASSHSSARAATSCPSTWRADRRGAGRVRRG